MNLVTKDLERLFDGCFGQSHRTILVGGGEEPLYIPSASPETAPHQVIYREDYFASALHEVAHWCLAGADRRLLDDYGYWYSPDGRDAEQQAKFESAEARPQALESLFSEACNFPFNLSADNLGAGFGPSDRFQLAVEEARTGLVAGGLPRRADLFTQALASAVVARGE